EEVRSRDRVAGPRIGPGGDESARGQARVRGAAGSREEREAPTESRQSDEDEDESGEAEGDRKRWEAQSAVDRQAQERDAQVERQEHDRNLGPGHDPTVHRMADGGSRISDLGPIDPTASITHPPRTLKEETRIATHRARSGTRERGDDAVPRSEERRVGKERRSGWWPGQ